MWLLLVREANEQYRKRAIELINEHKFDEHSLLMIRSYFNITSP